MRKYLPLILLGVGVLVLILVFFLVKSKKPQEEGMQEETALLDVVLKDRPVVSLTPTSDGHYLNLNIDKITIDADTLDYELLYKTKEGITQGVPGSVTIKGNDNFSAELLLGSESSGKFRYDEGVETGTITLRFRNDEGKLLVKFEGEFHLQNNTDQLTTTDGSFRYSLDDVNENYFVTMNTVGYPEGAPIEPTNGPYGIFTQAADKIPGEVSIGGTPIYAWDGNSWSELSGTESNDVGIFIAQ